MPDSGVASVRDRRCPFKVSPTFASHCVNSDLTEQRVARLARQQVTRCPDTGTLQQRQSAGTRASRARALTGSITASYLWLWGSQRRRHRWRDRGTPVPVQGQSRTTLDDGLERAIAKHKHLAAAVQAQKRRSRRRRGTGRRAPGTAHRGRIVAGRAGTTGLCSRLRIENTYPYQLIVCYLMHTLLP